MSVYVCCLYMYLNICFDFVSRLFFFLSVFWLICSFLKQLTKLHFDFDFGLDRFRIWFMWFRSWSFIQKSMPPSRVSFIILLAGVLWYYVYCNNKNRLNAAAHSHSLAHISFTTIVWNIIYWPMELLKCCFRFSFPLSKYCCAHFKRSLKSISIWILWLYMYNV